MQIRPGRHRIRPCSCRIWPALTSTARAIAGDRHQHRRQRKLLRREERRGLAAAVLAPAWASSQVLHRRREGGKEGWGSSAAAQVSALVALTGATRGRRFNFLKGCSKEYGCRLIP
ncbi:hypothetical protein SEVIR_9G258733v4 [Setaria viridis]|uniref:Uncharacterized protein n=1 Tax=Setaria viridis TaxID=4556 RepID=A0A4U6TA02_SETVI|nr:hypothetical protein SEVIR_9G258733v2 [Setaria viridis]